MLKRMIGATLRTAIQLKGRTLFLLIGITTEEIVVSAFDYALYPFVIWKYGLLKGGAIMALLSLIVCYAVLVLYNLTKKDWFGIELIKKLREYKGKGKIFRILFYFFL